VVAVPYDYDPELAEVIPLLHRLPLKTAADVAAARSAEAELFRPDDGADTADLDVEDRNVPGPAGAPEVAVRVYRPVGPATGRAALLLLHGGGFVLGGIEGAHADAAALARDLDAVVVSVGYRLAPEHPYPAAVEDCYAALGWLAGAVARLGVDPARVGVLGRSAGGGLAAALALLTRDRGGPALCVQHLCAPMLDDRLETPSMRAFTDTPTWDRASTAASWSHYLGEAGRAEVPPYAAPARATDLRGLPPAYVATMAYDPLRDEGILYALRLMEAGVRVELHSFPGTFHAAGLVATAAVARRVAEEERHTLRRALAGS
jgi:acetyl esterase/lipase